MFGKNHSADGLGVKAALGFAVVAALLGEGRAAACTLAPGTSAREFYRARLAEIRNAPIVVEGYVEVRIREGGNTPELPVARVIARRTYKGARRAFYALNYYPTTCHVPFPTNKAKRQKVYLRDANGSYYIVHVEPLK